MSLKWQKEYRWRLANPERYKEVQRRYLEKNRDVRKEQSKIWPSKETVYRRLRYAYKLRGADLEAMTAAHALGCRYCGQKDSADDKRTADALQVDHKIPVSRGGTNDPENLQWVCRRCNHAKNCMTEDEFLGHIKRILYKDVM